MRRNFKNERTATAKTIGKKTACMVAMMTAMFALTACGDEETPEEKLKNELSSAIEDIGNSMIMPTHQQSLKHNFQVICLKTVCSL